MSPRTVATIAAWSFVAGFLYRPALDLIERRVGYVKPGRLHP